MTHILYLQDPYLKEFSARVMEIVGTKGVVLDRTAFYPQGGGQPSDRGTIKGAGGAAYDVVLVQKRDGKIVHECAQDVLFSAGDIVECSLDWQRRYTLMRYHTAAHVVAGVFNLDGGALITGNQLDIDGGRIDFDLETFDKGMIEAFFRRCNDLIAQDLRIKDYYLSRDEAAKDPSLFKLAMALPQSLKELHILEIEGFDRQADAGTHVRSLAEIGRIEFIRADNKGKTNRRVYFRIVP